MSPRGCEYDEIKSIEVLEGPDTTTVKRFGNEKVSLSRHPDNPALPPDPGG